MTFSFDIAAAVVGFLTLGLFWMQLRDQKALSNRLADLQYCKMMEERLIAILYQKQSANDTIHSAANGDFYKFHFFRGFINTGNSGPDRSFQKISDCKFDQKIKEEYVRLYKSMIDVIKTDDLKNHYKESRFEEVFKLFDGK